MSTIKILIADDHAIVREGLRFLISNKAGIELVGEAGDGEEVIRLARALKPDVILIDLVMPRKDGLTAISEIKKENPEARILVLTSYADDNKVFTAIKAGALGYLLKDTPPAQLIEAIQDVYEGKPTLHPNIARMLFKEISQPSSQPAADNRLLTDREVDVLKCVAQGMTDQEIGEKLFISRWTVHAHVRNILGKLHLANRTQATLYALRENITRIDPK
jgi:two-component system, NarL family, response regulator LiaR